MVILIITIMTWQCVAAQMVYSREKNEEMKRNKNDEYRIKEDEKTCTWLI